MITRNQIIKALATEPLKAGNWIQCKADLNCKVCAVGAIVRSRLTSAQEKKLNIEEYNFYKESLLKDKFSDICEKLIASNYNFFLSLSDKISYLIENEDYMSALSSYFENNYYGRSITDVDRERIIGFVAQNFPAKLDVDLPRTL